MKSKIYLALFLGAACASAQEPLSLKQAIALGLGKNPAVRAASAAQAEAGARTTQQRAALLPKLNFSESIQRGTNPVYVFGALLTQHRFTPANFAIDALNRPDALNNFQSQLSFQHVVFDGWRSAMGVKAARFGEGVVKEDSRRVDMDVIHAVARSYYAAVLAAESARVAAEARRSAEASLQRSEAMRDAGMRTDADVLTMRVHLATVREQQIKADNELQNARAALNDALGVPLDSTYTLTTALTAAGMPAEALEAYERQALERRPEARQALLAGQIAGAELRAARGAYLPQVIVHGAYEANRQTFTNRGGTNWIAGVELRLNLWNGNADKARAAEAAAAERRVEAERERAHSGIRLQVRRAYFDVRAAAQRVEVAQAAVAEAQEGLRILKTRYENGLANATELLQAETATLAAQNRLLAAVFDQRVAAIRLEQAAGTLTAEVEAVNP